MNIEENIIPMTITDNEGLVYWKTALGEVFAFPESIDKTDEGFTIMSDSEVNDHLNPILKVFTNGVDVRQALFMDLPGWYEATDDEIMRIAEEGALQAAVEQNAKYRSDAEIVIAPLQDKVELEIATDVDKAVLRNWKLYRIALAEVPHQEGYPISIEWPVKPE